MPLLRKSLLFCALALIALPGTASAAEPGFELTVFAGYRLDGEFEADDIFDIFDSELEVDESATYGLIADIPISRNFLVELVYSRQDSDLTFFEGGLLGDVVDLGGVNVEYLLGGVAYQWTPGQVRPFVGIQVGVARFDPDIVDDSDTRLAGSISGGVKFLFTDHVGLRLEGRAYWADIEDFDDDDDCCRFRDDDSFYQLEASAGLIFAF